LQGQAPPVSVSALRLLYYNLAVSAPLSQRWLRQLSATSVNYIHHSWMPVNNGQSYQMPHMPNFGEFWFTAARFIWIVHAGSPWIWLPTAGSVRLALPIQGKLGIVLSGSATSSRGYQKRVTVRGEAVKCVLHSRARELDFKLNS
jgi:hypothetical protein